jgi:hypothetical protein
MITECAQLLPGELYYIDNDKIAHGGMALPDQDKDLRISVVCPYCHERSGIVPAATTSGYLAVCRPGGDVAWWMGQCSGCRNMVLVRQGMARMQGGREYVPIPSVFPTPQPTPTDERIPGDIRHDLIEAKQCFSVPAYKASAAMSRRTLEGACDAKGATRSNLSQKIDELYEKNIITKDMHDMAHAVRLVGNEGAHAFAGQVDEEDARDILQLAEQFVHVLFVTGAIAESQLRKRGR